MAGGGRVAISPMLRRATTNVSSHLIYVKHSLLRIAPYRQALKELSMWQTHFLPLIINAISLFLFHHRVRLFLRARHTQQRTFLNILIRFAQQRLLLVPFHFFVRPLRLVTPPRHPRGKNLHTNESWIWFGVFSIIHFQIYIFYIYLFHTFVNHFRLLARENHRKNWVCRMEERE